MKKQTILTAILSLVFAGALGASVSATGTGSSTKDVYVGSVPDPIYSVDIAWGDFQYNWTYNQSNNSYAFKPDITCGKYTEGYPGIIAWGGYFTNNTCTTAFSGTNFTDAYVWRGVPAVIVIDNSTNGHVASNVSFAPSSSYSWVTGKFYGGYSLQDKEMTYSGALTNGNMVRSNIDGLAQAYLELQASNGASHTSSVKTGDKIGTITLTISPDTN